MPSDLLPEPAAPPGRPVRQLARGLRWFGRRVWFHAKELRAPPVLAPADQVAYGFAQPVLGLKVLLSDRDLLLEALYPAGLLAAACAVYASLQGNVVGEWRWFVCFYKAFAALAPFPSVVFANHYARLAALVRWRLGFGVCGPREMPLSTVIARAVKQFVIVAIGIAPFWLAAHILPFVGGALAGALFAIWGVHWVVVDALDDARVLHPGETLRSAEAEDARAPAPWFVRLLLATADRLRPLAGPLRWFARRCDALAIHWRGEIAILERHRAVSLGFALSTAALLATPVLNLLFRPIVLVASSHLLGHLEDEAFPRTLPELPAISGAAARF